MSTEKSSMCAREINKFLDFTLGNEREELIAGIIDEFYPKTLDSRPTEGEACPPSQCFSKASEPEGSRNLSENATKSDSASG